MILNKLSDPNILSKLTEKDPKLKKLFDSVNPDAFDTVYKPPYTALVGAIVGQVISYEEAKKIRGKLYNLLGSADFTIADVEKITNEQFKEIGLDDQKIEIIRTANAFILRYYIDLSNPNDLAKLLGIKGIGEWTIQTTKLTSMTDVDIFPCNDVFLRKKVQQLYDLPRRPTEKQTATIAKKWAPYRSIVCWYLWRWFD